jgi:hypothetical protein
MGRCAMKNAIAVGPLSRLTFATTILCVACSDTPKGGSTSAVPPIAPSLHTQSVPTASLASLDAAMPSTWPDLSWAAVIQVSPWTQCNVYPQGASNDPTRFQLIQAGLDGAVRFYAPPPAWGTKLTLSCNLNGAPQSEYLVDLNDSSTFQHESGSDLDAKVVGTQPALSGNLSTISPEELFRQGYPPRPDPSSQPSLYSQWVQSVSKPATLVQLVPVALIGGAAGTGTYEGPCNQNQTGFIQAAVGFNKNPLCETLQASSGNQLYEEYVMGTTIPNNVTCPATGCLTYIWAGIGGVLSQYTNSQVHSSLIQSGFSMASKNSTITPHLYFEFINAAGVGPPYTPNLPSGFRPGDVVLVVGGGVSSQACSTLDALAPYGCYQWFDLTSGYETTPVVLANPGTTGCTASNDCAWFPTTTEYIVENPPDSAGTADYGVVGIYGYGVDWDGVDHYDPGNTSGTDAFECATQMGNFNTLAWFNGPCDINSPQDPMFLEYLNY